MIKYTKQIIVTAAQFAALSSDDKTRLLTQGPQFHKLSNGDYSGCATEAQAPVALAIVPAAEVLLLADRVFLETNASKASDMANTREAMRVTRIVRICTVLKTEAVAQAGAWVAAGATMAKLPTDTPHLFRTIDETSDGLFRYDTDKKILGPATDEFS